MSGKLIAYVGTYGAEPGAKGGGIYALEVARDGTSLAVLSHAPDPVDAGYVLYVPEHRTLYAVDERKTDGRGPVKPPAAVHSLVVGADGALSWKNKQLAPGPRPCYLNYSAAQDAVLVANHGDFQNIERVVKTAAGWSTEYVYDDSTLIMYGLEADGALGAIRDLHVFEGQGKDPNFSKQNGGHAQSNPHAHCAVVDPSGAFAIVCDKGTDQIYVFRLGATLEVASAYHMEAETAPRHAVFDPRTGLLLISCELSSEVASFRLDERGVLSLLDRQSTLAPSFKGANEPAEIRVHPQGRYAYVNNRGEDTLAWFALAETGALMREGHVQLAKSIHPGLAARSFAFDPTGAFLLVADRPADLVRSYRVDAGSGALEEVAALSVPDPAHICFADFGRAAQ